MSNFQKIKIDGVEYNIIDSIQDFRAEDSFIHRSNKLAQYDGNGDSKKHVGTYKGDLGQRMSTFFDYATWGLEHFDAKKKRKSIESARESGAVIQDKTCFFSKSNLLKYLEDAKAEYYGQEQIYHNDISAYYNERYQEVLKSADNPQQFVRELQKAGYATDPAYASKISQIAKTMNSYQNYAAAGASTHL